MRHLEKCNIIKVKVIDFDAVTLSVESICVCICVYIYTHTHTHTYICCSLQIKSNLMAETHYVCWNTKLKVSHT